jgi:phage head maturation protease
MADQQGYIIEFHRIGNAVKVSAMDPATLTEVSIVGDPNLGEAQLSRVAIRKLEFMLAKAAKAVGKDPAGKNG